MHFYDGLEITTKMTRATKCLKNFQQYVLLCVTDQKTVLYYFDIMSSEYKEVNSERIYNTKNVCAVSLPSVL